MLIRGLLVVVLVLIGMLLVNDDARDRLTMNIQGLANAGGESGQLSVGADSVSPSGLGQEISASEPASVGSTTSRTPPYDGLPADVRLKIPSLKIDAPIVAVGLTADGEVEAPSTPDMVAWYNLSPIPGTPGNSILSGHIDWKNSTAVFWELHSIKNGDVINVSSPGRAESSYVVEWVERYPFDQAPLDRIFASLYEPALTIITCEGDFDQATHNYSERLVVRARGG